MSKNSEADDDTVALIAVVCDGTRYCGTVPSTSGRVTLEADCAARLIVTELFSRGSTKYSSGTVPLFVTRTRAVTGVPAVSDPPSGRPLAEAATGVSLTVTVNGWAVAVPDTAL